MEGGEREGRKGWRKGEEGWRDGEVGWRGRDGGGGMDGGGGGGGREVFCNEVGRGRSLTKVFEFRFYLCR